MHYTELIQCCDRVPNAFLRGYCHDLGRQLGVPLDLTTSRPHLYLSDAERATHPLTLSSAAGDGWPGTGS